MAIPKKVSKTNYDFCGWATRTNIKCSDGRMIMPDAFKHNDGTVVPLCWQHRYSSPADVIGQALLENRPEGVYAYGLFNDSENGKMAKALIEHGDIDSLSIHANKLQQYKSSVIHGDIKEVSLVVAGANPEAHVDDIIRHGELVEDEVIIYSGEFLELFHSDVNDLEEGKKKEDVKMDGNEKKPDGSKTVKEVIDSMTEEQKTVLYGLMGAVMDNNSKSDENDKPEGGKEMKHNLFDGYGEEEQDATLTHSDEVNILNLAKSSSVGSLRDAMEIYAEQNDSLSHAFENVEALFPDYKDVRPGIPETLRDDESWVPVVINKANKSPISRIRTRLFDARSESVGDSMRALGYKKGDEKKYTGKVKQLKRTTDPQTVYVKDKLDRDDIIDITDFDVVSYMYNGLRSNLKMEVARAALIGDGRDDGDEYKISEDHIRSIWNDDELYTIHRDVDIEAAKRELQGTNTGANFGENYIYAEAIITATLYSREKYKGSGSPDLFCAPHLINTMLLARDLNGRRIYNSISEIAAALNVKNIYTVEQFTDKVRTDEGSNKHKLLGLFVNLADYQFGSTKGGEITQFNQFDIDFNQEKYLIETRLSGALTRPFSAIALEEPVVKE